MVELFGHYGHSKIRFWGRRTSWCLDDKRSRCCATSAVGEPLEHSGAAEADADFCACPVWISGMGLSMESRWRLWRKRQYIYWSRCSKSTAVACFLKPPRGSVKHEDREHVLGEELTGINTVTKSARCVRAMPARCCVFRWRRSARLWAGMRFSSLHAISCPMCCIDTSSSWPKSATGTLNSVSARFSPQITFSNP